MAESLYNRERPHKFKEVKGQDHVIEPLRLAVQKGHLSRTSILGGKTGGGKTTVARIIASALNCLHPESDGEPCGECTVCTSIREGTCLDYYEMDSSTNGAKEDMERLVKECNYAPMTCKYKVYVIDEAHMLTVGANNTLLKTLEQPPEHVYFILCTTEPGAFLNTVFNRCARYTFGSIPTGVIFDYLKELREKYSFRITDGALSLIAKKAKGSMRDALSQYEQVVQGVNGEVTEENVKSILAYIDDVFVAKFLSYLVVSDIKNAYDCISSVEKMAVEVGAFMAVVDKVSSDAISFLTRGALSQMDEIIDEEYFTEVSKLCRVCELPHLVDIIKMLCQAKQSVRTESGYSALKLSIVQVCMPSTRLLESTERVAYLENQIASLTKVLNNIFTGTVSYSAAVPEVQREEVVQIITDNIPASSVLKSAEAEEQIDNSVQENIQEDVTDAPSVVSTDNTVSIEKESLISETKEESNSIHFFGNFSEGRISDEATAATLQTEVETSTVELVKKEESHDEDQSSSYDMSDTYCYEGNVDYYDIPYEQFFTSEPLTEDLVAPEQTSEEHVVSMDQQSEKSSDIVTDTDPCDPVTLSVSSDTTTAASTENLLSEAPTETVVSKESIVSSTDAAKVVNISEIIQSLEKLKSSDIMIASVFNACSFSYDDSGVIIATPFGPTAEILISYISAYEIGGVTVLVDSAVAV